MYAEELVQVGRALLPTLETVYGRLLRPDAQGRPAATMSGEDLVRWHRLALEDVHSAVGQFQHAAFDALGPRSYGASVHRLDSAISACWRATWRPGKPPEKWADRRKRHWSN